VDAVLAAAGGVDVLPTVRRVVIVGIKISPGNPLIKPDGTMVRTLWGEIAWQLGGPAAYARLAADVERATCPGDALRELLLEFGPALILIDEWVPTPASCTRPATCPARSLRPTFPSLRPHRVAKVAKAASVFSLPAFGHGRVSPRQASTWRWAASGVGRRWLGCAMLSAAWNHLGAPPPPKGL
jgi:hypothetical protein